MNTVTQSVSHDMSELDDLLADSMEQVQKVKRSRDIVKRARNGQATEDEVEELYQHELTASWKAVHICEFWKQCTCNCGNSFEYFSHYMTEFHQTGGGTARRFIRVDEGAEPDTTLTPKALFQVLEVGHCSECSAPAEGSEIEMWED